MANIMVNETPCFSSTPELPLLQEPEGDSEEPELEETDRRPLTPESLPSLVTVSG